MTLEIELSTKETTIKTENRHANHHYIPLLLIKSTDKKYHHICFVFVQSIVSFTQFILALDPALSGHRHATVLKFQL